MTTAPQRPLRILHHDNTGLAFFVQLSRALAERGHEVLHTHMATFHSPKGPLAPQPDDPPTLRLHGLDLGGEFPKYSYWRRWQHERRYGQALAERIALEKPDVVLMASTPPEMLAIVQATCRRLRIPFVFWVQDLYGYAIQQILGHKYWGLGRAIAAYYIRKEATVLRHSDRAVVITEDFLPFVSRAGLALDRVSVIPNWAPIEDMPQQPRRNAWSASQGLEEALVFMYSGTLGLKHNPGVLLALAETFRHDPRVRVVVVSEGLGADWLRQAVAAAGLSNVVQLPFQPFDRMPEVLASADVLVAVLEECAGVFSVPSKILSYLCAARPVLLSAPLENQAAKLIAGIGAGEVCAAGQDAALVAAAQRLAGDAAARSACGQKGRAYAEQHFPIGRLADRFEQLLAQSVRDAR